MRNLVVLGVIGAGLAVVLIGCQRQYIYHPRAYEPGELGLLPRNAVQLTFSTSAGRQTAFYLPSAAFATSATTASVAPPPRRLWVCFQGNGSTALDWIATMQGVRAPGVGFLLVDYPGYGLCEGKPTRASIVQATEAAYAALAQHYGVTTASLDRDVGALGYSLGTAAALEFASRHPVRRVVLLAPFTSLVDMAHRTAGWLLSRIVFDRFDNRARLAELAARRAPPRVTIFHGTDDSVVPFAMGDELARAHPAMIDFQAVPGSNHGDLLRHIEPPLRALLAQPPDSAP